MVGIGAGKASGLTLEALDRIHKMSLIMVDDFLGHEFNLSKLYYKDFKYEYRP